MHTNVTTLNVVGSDVERATSPRHGARDQHPIFARPTIDAEALQGHVRPPTISQLIAVANEVGLDVTSSDATSYINLMAPYIAAYNVVRTLPEKLTSGALPALAGLPSCG